MISSIDFVKQKIDELVIQFPSIKCSYEFDESDNTHSVEILPSEFFILSEEFSIIENNIYNEFFDLFPYEGLYFITDDVLVPVSHPVYSRQGSDYTISRRFNNADALKVNLLNDSFNYNVCNHGSFKVNSVNAISVFSTNYNIIVLPISPGMINIPSNKTLITPCGEVNYALAA
ncbi:MAG: hypothetical protein EAZ15_00315 [Sphingobacteriales bacterium]|nr:MAG: hypothetical protein EAZ15_00315 [Sphingobacteriales bacterium]